ncbi:erythromycin esterase family protein [Streptomyces sp. NBC_00237]|uniref:erythromycin esterase family protein n=1 Tax=Streptomyces sp. NBC_00237 TaxID=2975687 RepID=UPI0022502737|nr:erythromycin esterase family protein [Streptomyces sp. NBC_00237]MCX5205104.1 erythromycin esterase family protein [Streptomyces sp. NBC_00237]
MPAPLHSLGLHFGDDAEQLAFAADQLLASFPRSPLLLGLGEPTHGAEQFLELRNDLFFHLVRHHGYRAIAIESDCLAAAVVDDHVTTGAGDLDEVLATGITHRFGGLAANRDLVVRLREYNTGLPPAEQVRFHGFDGPLDIGLTPSPRAALLAAHAHLAARLPAHRVPYDADELRELLGDDAPWADAEALKDPARSIGGTERAGALRVAAADVLAVYETELPTLRPQRAVTREPAGVVTAVTREPAGDVTAATAFDRAYTQARTARGLLRYHAAMASTVPDRIAVMLGIRDAMMAENLLALAAAQRSPSLVFAHNTHLQRTRCGMNFLGEQRWWGAGALVAASAIGDRYAFVAADSTPEAAAACAPSWADPSDAAQPDGETFQQALADASPARAFFPAAPLAAHPGVPDLRAPGSWWYAPLDPADLHAMDAVAFVGPLREENSLSLG